MKEWFGIYWTPLAATVGGVFAIINFFSSRREKKAFKRYEIFQEKKLEVTTTFLFSLEQLIFHIMKMINLNNHTLSAYKKSMDTDIGKFMEYMLQFADACMHIQPFYNKKDLKDINSCFTATEQIGEIILLHQRDIKECIVTEDSQQRFFISDVRTQMKTAEAKYDLVRLNILKFYRSE